MFRADLKNYEEVRSELRRLGRNIPKAAAMSLTWAGQAAKAAANEKTKKVFDRPTRWTTESTYLKAANARTLQAVVFIKDGSIKSLAHHIEGDPRPAKASEKLLRWKGVLRGSNQYIVPSLALRLDRYGNVPRGMMNKILSSVGAQLDRHANTSTKSLKRNASQGDFFVVARQRGTHPGIYRRKGGKSNPRLDPVLMFIKSTKYRRRYPFYETVEDSFYDALPGAINRSIDRISR